MIEIGQLLPNGKLTEYIDANTDGRDIGPHTFNVCEALRFKTIAMFGVPGAFTPTCSEQHLPGYIRYAAEFKAKGIDEIWAISVNDAFVMGAWGRAQQTAGKIRMMADGNGEYIKRLGLDADFSQYGMGRRAQRFSALIADGVVTRLNIDLPGQLKTSDARTLLKQLEGKPTWDRGF